MDRYIGDSLQNVRKISNPSLWFKIEPVFKKRFLIQKEII